MNMPIQTQLSDQKTDSPHSLGKHLRKRVPRKIHAKWQRDPNLDLLAIVKQMNADRIPELVPIKYGRMLASPLAFFRGEPRIMACDLAPCPQTGIKVQACGDAHLQNFGLFASPERNLLFDINDFDETLEGPWEWDIKRLATILILAGRRYDFSDSEGEDCVETAVREYQTRIREYSQVPALDLWYMTVNCDRISKAFRAKERGHVDKSIEDARKHDHRESVEKFTRNGDNALQFRERPPILQHAEKILSDETLRSILASYRESLIDAHRALFDAYEVADHVLKVVGVSSVGTRCFAVLFAAKHGPEDHLILQLKEATPSVLEGLVGPRWNGNQGQRTVLGQRLIQGFTDIFLGWATDGKRDYYVRQLRDMKGRLDPRENTVTALQDYARLCGWTLARAHARSGNAASIAGYIGKGSAFADATTKFALLYADQTEEDFDNFKLAVRSGLLPAETGV